MTTPPRTALSFFAVEGMPEVRAGDDLAALLKQSLSGEEWSIRDGDVIVVTQKVISKAENRYVDLRSVSPSAEAIDIARRCRKDPRFVELVLRESSAVVRVAPEVLIVRHRLGFVVANAAIDQSNLPGGDGERALLLPADPDASAESLRLTLGDVFRAKVAVLVSDSFGRPWRMGVTGVCIGCAGMTALFDARGMVDRSGRPLQVTQLAVADQLCASATLVGGEAAEGRPVVIVRGVSPIYLETSRPAHALVRPVGEDLFQ